MRAVLTSLVPAVSLDTIGRLQTLLQGMGEEAGGGKREGETCKGRLVEMNEIFHICQEEYVLQHGQCLILEPLRQLTA